MHKFQWGSGQSAGLVEEQSYTTLPSSEESVQNKRKMTWCRFFLLSVCHKSVLSGQVDSAIWKIKKIRMLLAAWADSITLAGSCGPSGFVLQTGAQHTSSSSPAKVVSQLFIFWVSYHHRQWTPFQFKDKSMMVVFYWDTWTWVNKTNRTGDYKMLKNNILFTFKLKEFVFFNRYFTDTPCDALKLQPFPPHCKPSFCP